MIKKGEGIVLRCVNYSNTSLVTTVYSEDKGKIGIIAKGIRKGKPTRQFPGTMEPYYHIYYVIYQKPAASLATLNEFELRNAFYGIRKDLKRIYTSLYLVDFMLENTIENDPCPGLFHLLKNTLQHLSSGDSPDHLRFLFQMKALAFLGSKPNVNICNQCNKSLDKTIITFSLHNLAAYCQECKKNIHSANMSLSKDAVSYLQYIYPVKLVQVNQMKEIPRSLKQELDHFFRFYLRCLLNKELRTAKYLK